jgi:excisionase family DNA binding protein
MNDALLTVKDVAALLNVPTSRVYDRWKDWDLPALRIGGHLRFRRSAVDAWLEGRAA